MRFAAVQNEQSILIGFTLLYFKMAVIPLVPETKMVDVGKLISPGNLLVRKISLFVFTTTSATLILSRAFEADKHCLYILSFFKNSLSYILTYRDSTHTRTHTHTHTHTHSLSLSLSLTFRLTETTHSLSLSLSLSLHFDLQRQHTLSLFISTSRNSLTLPVSKTQFNTCNMGAYTFCNLFLSCSAFSVRLFPASNTASEISSNPERDKQPTWEKACSS